MYFESEEGWGFDKLLKVGGWKHFFSVYNST